MNRNVALFAPKFPPTSGGASVYFRQVVRALARTEYTPVVFAPGPPTPLDDECPVPVVRGFPPLGAMIHRGVFHVPRLHALLTDYEIDVAHVHPHFPQYRWFKWMLRALDIPRVYDCRDQEFARWLVRDGQHYLSATADIDGILHDECGVAAHEISRSPVVLPDMTPTPMELGEGLHVAFVGDLVEHKGVRIAVEAVARLARDRDVTLHIAGDGGEAEWVARRARDAPVTMHGQLPHEECVGLIASVDAVVMPSKTEGRPRVALEAMHVGTPVVGTAVGELPAVVDDAGVIVARCVNAVTTGLRTVLDDAAMQQRAARREVCEDIAAVRDALWYAYTQALESGGTA